MKAILGSMLIALFSCSAMTACDFHDRNISPDLLKATELRREDVQRSALLGDSAAAKAMALHFAVKERNASEEVYWWRVAAENGDPVAMRTLANFLSREGGQGCARAIFWLGRTRDATSRWDEEFEDINAELLEATRNLKSCESRHSTDAPR